MESGEVVTEKSVAKNRSSTALINLDRDPKGYPLVPQEAGNLANMKAIVTNLLEASLLPITVSRLFLSFSSVLITLNT